MRQAILTKYLGPTNVRGSRVKAWACAGSVTLSWDDALNSEDNHTVAAIALMRKFNWHEKQDIIGGSMPKSEKASHCFVLVPKVK